VKDEKPLEEAEEAEETLEEVKDEKPLEEAEKNEETFEEVEDEEALEEVEDEKSLEEVKEEETLEVTEEKSCDEKVAMSRTYHTKEGFLKIDYINYNKVRICKSGQPDEVKVFDSSKEAVDFYVEQMQRFEEIYGEA